MREPDRHPSLAERIATRVERLGGAGAMLAMLLRAHPFFLAFFSALLVIAALLSLALAWSHVAPSAYVVF